MVRQRLCCHHGNTSVLGGPRHSLGRIFPEGSRSRKRKWHVDGPAEAPVSKCCRFWKVLISATHKAEELGPPLSGCLFSAASGSGAEPLQIQVISADCGATGRAPAPPCLAAAPPPPSLSPQGSRRRRRARGRIPRQPRAAGERRARAQADGQRAGHVGGGAGRGLAELLHRGGPCRRHRDNRQRVQRSLHPVSGAGVRERQLS